MGRGGGGDTGGGAAADADLLRVCQEAGAARMRAEAAALAGKLDEAGVVLLFCDRVYLQPDKVNSHRIAALSYPSPPSSPPRFAGSPPSRLGLPVLLAAGYPCCYTDSVYTCVWVLR